MRILIRKNENIQSKETYLEPRRVDDRMVDEPQLGRVEVSSSALAFTRSVDEVAHVSTGGQARHTKRVGNVVTVVGAQSLSETIDEGLEVVLG